jgi:hypothetical protein
MSGHVLQSANVLAVEAAAYAGRSIIAVVAMPMAATNPTAANARAFMMLFLRRRSKHRYVGTFLQTLALPRSSIGRDRCNPNAP